MKFARFTYGTFGFLAVGSLAWGCSSKTNDCDANKTCGPYGASGSSGDSGSPNATGGKSGAASGGEGGASGEGGDSGQGGNAGSGGAACVGTASPDTTACVIGDGYGLFVSLSGDDAIGDGTEAHPLATVTKALSLTGPGKLNRIYVCATANGNTTSYDEPNTLVIPDRVSLYGGFTCVAGDWKYVDGTKAYIKPESAIGATITSAMNGVTLQDVRIDAQNAEDNGTGASSFGMIVSTSKNVVLTRVEIHAGKGGGGAKGAAGLTGADGDPPVAAQKGTDVDCSDATPQAGGVASASSACNSRGGDGGIGYLSLAGGMGGPGTPTDHLSPPGQANGGPGATSTGSGFFGLSGGQGGSGISGLAGVNGASIGLFSATGYAVASGGNGSGGYPGQGGGGGGASMGNGAKMPVPGTCVGASGGAGGMGGCGGQGGGGGVGGGASVALLISSSGLTLDSSLLVASSGGAGGEGGKAHSGGAGGTGGPGGAANTLNSMAKGGAGGDGGNGGNGGSGAGGTGGPSIAVVFVGTTPSVKDSTLTPSSGGAHGAGGKLGTDPVNWGPDGSDGMTKDLYQQP